MFYIRTADRLQRTASWLESLDGGLDYLRAVIVDDSLGIGGELDAAMARHVERYEDEWAAVLADPERLRRFVSFVNAPGTPDPSIAFVSERGQPRPADLPVPVGGSRAAAGGGPVISTSAAWTAVCRYGDLQPERGVAALIGSEQVALFRMFDGTLHAIGNQDPFTGAYVLSRGHRGKPR